MSSLYESRIFCVSEGATWVHCLSTSPALPTTCPNSVAHTVRSAQELQPIAMATRIGASNSPYSPAPNTVIVADTSAGNIVVNLPTAADGHLDALIIVHKAAAANSVTLVARAGETIDGDDEPILLTEHDATARLQSNGTADWESVSGKTASDFMTAHAGQLQSAAAASSSKEWEFRCILANGRNNERAYVKGWRDVTLNETRVDGGRDALRSSSTITLEPGKYRIFARQTFYRTERTRIRLRNIDSNTTLAVSPSLYDVSLASIDSTFDIDAATPQQVRLQYYVHAVGKDAGSSSDESEGGSQSISAGLGRACGFGEPEVYTLVRLIKMV